MPTLTNGRIRHSVAFSLRHAEDSAEEAGFLEAIARLEAIPGVEAFELMREVSPKNDFRFGLTMEFADPSAYAAYNEHPDHVALRRPSGGTPRSRTSSRSTPPRCESRRVAQADPDSSRPWHPVTAKATTPIAEREKRHYVAAGRWSTLTGVDHVQLGATDSRKGGAAMGWKC